MKLLLFFFFLATIVLLAATSSTEAIPYQIQLLRPHSASAGQPVTGLNCMSWRLAVETNNIQDWDLVPAECANYVGDYMIGSQYPEDCNFVASAAYEYAKSVELKGDGKDIWVFDIDETSLSNLPYYARPDVQFGSKEYNATAAREWELEGIAPALPATLNLYNELLKLGYKIVFLTGKSESIKNVTEINMKNVGYHTWEKLILKQTSEKGTTAVVYKSKKRGELVKQGYRIIGNMGDQWSDLLGDYVGNRTFKLPNPMFYT